MMMIDGWLNVHTILYMSMLHAWFSVVHYRNTIQGKLYSNNIETQSKKQETELSV